MCGIAGFMGWHDKPTLERMTQALSHRGPDDSGFYFKEDTGLGHRRLSIIDLDTGKQPISNEGKNIWVVFNGEIYNYRQLREHCKKRGHAFSTNSDTEVIVHLYEDLGTDFVKELNGCFALALWDERLRRLILARDRLGIRPLFYVKKEGAVFFASEIKSFLAAGLLRKEINHQALNDYLSLRYIPGESAMLKGVCSLPPASVLICERGSLKSSVYWNVSFSGRSRLKPQELVEKFRFLLEDSVRLRLMSDVPLGAYLSSGVDSSSIVSLMAANSEQPVKTFSLGFGNDNDEFNEAAALAGMLGAKHDTIMLGSRDYELLPKIVRHLDNPVGDAIIIPTYILARYASARVKSVLTGEGADEILGGYIHQLMLFYGNIYHKLSPGFLKKAAGGLFKIIPPGLLNKLFIYPADLGSSGKNRLVNYFSNDMPGAQAYFALAGLFSSEEKRKLFAPDFYREYIAPGRDSALEGFSRYFKEKPGDPWDKLLLLDLENWLPSYTLFKQDALSMANSLEARVPFLDHRLVEFCALLPAGMRIRGITVKYILRKAAESFLPRETAWRPKKSFYLPARSCFAQGFLGYIRDNLSEDTIRRRKMFNNEYVGKLISNFLSGDLLDEKKIVALLVLEVWFKEFMD